MDTNRPVHFFTVDRRHGPVEIKIKGSRFISFIYPVSRKSDLSGILTKLKKTFYDATHICYAFRLEEGGAEQVRFHDDGEPSATAGLPIFNQIKGNDFFNVLVAVIRYFGGVKLGTGSLARAYSQSAREVLEGAEKIPFQIMKRASISFDYGLTGEIRNLLNRFPVQIVHEHYTGDGVQIELLVPEACLETVNAGLRESSRGKIELELDAG